MRVLQVIPGVSPQHGGPSVALTDMTRLLCDRGVDARILTTNTDPAGRWDVPLGKVVERRGARVVYYDIWPVNRYAFSAPLARALLTETRQYDVVHIHWLFNFSSIMAAVAARRAKVPYVFQPNGSLDPNLMRRNAWVKNVYIGLFGRFILRNAAAISYASLGEKRIARWSSPRVPSEVIPIGLDWKDYEQLPSPGAFRRTFPELAGKRILLFLSRISRQKGLDLLIRAFREIAPEFPDVQLVLAGPDGEGYGTGVKAWIAEAGLTGRVTFAGRVPDEIKLAAYVDADWFVLPSYAENFGAVVTEAMACRCPVVISNRVNISDEVAAGGAGMVVECEVTSLARGLIETMRDPQRARAMGERGRALVRECFTWDVALDRVIPLYHRLHDEAARVSHGRRSDSP